MRCALQVLAGHISSLLLKSSCLFIEKIMHKGFTLWFTGLSGSGKSTLAHRLEYEFRERQYRVEVLDGDVVRTNLSKGLDFDKEGRDTNVRRIGFVCDLLSRNGVIAIASAIFAVSGSARAMSRSGRKSRRGVRRSSHALFAGRTGAARCQRFI